jgi:hypothetical protein
VAFIFRLEEELNREAGLLATLHIFLSDYAVVHPVLQNCNSFSFLCTV